MRGGGDDGGGVFVMDARAKRSSQRRFLFIAAAWDVRCASGGKTVLPPPDERVCSGSSHLRPGSLLGPDPRMRTARADVLSGPEQNFQREPLDPPKKGKRDTDWD